MFPGCPNTTSVMHETDVNYGPFKMGIRNNLDEISTARFSQQKELTMGPHYVGLLVFGGVDPVSEIMCENAFEKGFSIEANEASWAKIGVAVKGSSPESAATITRACLQSAKVCHDGTDTNDPLFDKYQAIQAHNERATAALDYLGYKGHLLHVKFNEDMHRRKKPVTIKNSKE